jgi:hypothetical protein
MGGVLVLAATFDGSVQIVVDSTVIHLDLVALRRQLLIDPAVGVFAGNARRVYRLPAPATIAG